MLVWLYKTLTPPSLPYPNTDLTQSTHPNPYIVPSLAHCRTLSTIGSGTTATTTGTPPDERRSVKRPAEVTAEQLNDGTVDLMFISSGEARVRGQGAVCEVYSPPRLGPYAEAEGLGSG